MSKRVALFFTIIIGIFASTLLLIQLAKGYRPDITQGTLEPTGLLVATSDPEGAQVFIDNELLTATDDTVNLKPGEYTVEIRKDRFIPWKKRLKIVKELVTQTDAILFPIVPDLKALTFTGATNPTLSPSGTKILYAVPGNIAEETIATASTPRNSTRNRQDEKTGLWVLELADLPLGFNRDPRQLVIGNPTNLKWEQAEFIWSPDSREVLALFYSGLEATESSKINAAKEITQNPQQVFKITLSNTVTSSSLTNLSLQYPELLAEWNEELDKKRAQQIKTLPPEFADLIATATADLHFSPDESKLMYTATESAQLLERYIPPVPAASTQTQQRTLQKGNLYVYDIKEDRNFLISENNNTQVTPTLAAPNNKENNTPIDQLTTTLFTPSYQWFPSSRHLIHVDNNQITIMEYDRTNPSTIYSGNFPASQVFPHPSTSNLIILTSLNPAFSPTPNLYTLVLR